MMIPCSKISLPLLLILFFVCASQAQSSDTGQFLKNDPVKDKSLVDAITRQYEKDVADISGPNKKYITDLYKERFDLIKERFEENEVITSPDANNFLASLVNEIFKNNQTLNPRDLRILFSRDPWPNASSMGEGTILFNIGLFCRLDNESQAVFILCHELAHYYLDHSNKNIRQYVNTIYSDEFQEKLKTIQKSQYQQGSQLDRLTKGLMFKNRRHSREFERAADSMALELMKNTSYDLNEALTSLGLLDSVDRDKYDVDIDLKEHFNFISFPFQERWLEKEDLLLIKNENEEKERSKEVDSLKTHPDCKVRMEILRDRVKQYQKVGSKKFIINEEKFLNLKNAFDFEIIEYCYQSNHVSQSLYYALEMLHVYPNQAYLHAMIGKCLNQLYIHQKKHELGKIVDLPNPALGDRYNELLTFIQNLRLQEIAALSYYFLFQDTNKFSGSEDFLCALITSKENFNKPEEKGQWINFYKKNFPKGKYIF